MFHNVPARPLEMVLDGVKLTMTPKQFKSGSVGWYLGGKELLDGRRVQLSFSAVIVGSKPPADLIDISSQDDLRALMDKAANLPPAVDPRPEKARKPRKGKKTS